MDEILKADRVRRLQPYRNSHGLPCDILLVSSTASLDVPRRNRVPRPRSLALDGQVDSREGERPADPYGHARRLAQQGPREEARPDRLADEAEAYDRRRHPAQAPVIQRVPADLRDEGHREEEPHLGPQVADRREALLEEERVEEQDAGRRDVHDEGVGEERDPLPQPPPKEEIEAGRDAAREGQEVAHQARAPRRRVRDRDDDHAAEAQRDPDRHASVQSLPEDEM